MMRIDISVRKVADRRICVVTPGGTRARGGIGRLVSYMARDWDEPGFSLDVLDSYGPGLRALMPFYFVATLTRLLTNGMLGRIDLIHVNMTERLSVHRKGLVVSLGHAFNIPVVLHLHGAEFVEYCRALPEQRRQEIGRMMLKAQAIVVLGSYWRSYLVDELNIPPEKVVVLHNAVPGPSAVPSRAADDLCRLLFLGVVCTRKGIETLLAALPLLAKTDQAWHLTVAGHGDLDVYRLEAARLGVGDRVSFVGWVNEDGAKRLLAQSDVLVLPSRNEGLPMAILEGMSYGLPIVTTPVGSIADAVVDGETGRLVPVGDHMALAAALESLVEDPGLRKALGKGARRRYEEAFKLSSFNTKLARIFDEALNDDAPRSGIRPVNGTSPAQQPKAVGAR